MGKILDKIKQLFGVNQRKMLQEGIAPNPVDLNQRKRLDYIQNQRNEFRDSFKNNYLENSLSQYFEEYLKQINEGKDTKPYNVLTSLNAVNGNPELNRAKEQDLLYKINNSNMYHIQEQNSFQTGETYFYHIKSNNHRLPDKESMRRIYLNCRDENVAELVDCILKQNVNPNFYLKMVSTNYMETNQRSEKIVTYTDDNYLNLDLQTLRNVKMQRPDLFKDSDKMNPFMQQFENFYAVCAQVNTDDYMDLYGNRFNIPNSNNSYIAQIISDSYRDAAQSIAKKDPNIAFLLDNQYYNSMDLFVKNYPYINAYHHDELMRKMEMNMNILAHNNHIVINGVNAKPIINQEKQQTNENIR